ncbi:MAG: glycosyltransferase family 2 protein [Fimbriimonadaceae bacterium]
MEGWKCHNRKTLVAIVIPALNEEHRIGRVLRAAVTSELADEIIVVSDGSTDRTAEVASRFKGVRVIELPQNLGKGGAMMAGVMATNAAIITFIDADLTGLTGDHIDAIIDPVIHNEADMCLGIFRKGKFWSNAAQRVSPYFSGQRAMKRRLIERVPHIAEMRLGVEVAINTYAKRYRARVLRVILPGVSNTAKERKLGFVKGAKARVQMFSEIAQAYVTVRKDDRATRKSRARRLRK